MKFQKGDIIKVKELRNPFSFMIQTRGATFLILDVNEQGYRIHPLEVHVRNPDNDDPYFNTVSALCLEDCFDLISSAFCQEVDVTND